MLVSKNKKPSLNEFIKLVNKATQWLNEDTKNRSAYYLKRKWYQLEDDVKTALELNAKGTDFEGTIEKISGQRFPDIIANGFYGVEVKSSKDSKWTTLGGSVNESTRVENVEHIFLIFGKLVDPVEFCYRPYEECLSGIVVTHYPRYSIDMKLDAGNTIFDKMETTYNRLRLSENPVGEIVKFYKQSLKDGESLWWTGEPTREHEDISEMKVRLWNLLPKEEKNEYRAKGLAFFPEIFSKSGKKYERFSLWLAASHFTVSTSMRDIFSAGGKGTIKGKNKDYHKIPRVILHVQNNKEAIASTINNTDNEMLCNIWRVNKINDNRIKQWIDLVATNSTLKTNRAREILNSVFID